MNASFRLYKLKELILVTGLTEMVKIRFIGLDQIMDIMSVDATSQRKDVWMKKSTGKYIAIMLHMWLEGCPNPSKIEQS